MGSVSWPGRGARATSPASRAHWGVMRPGGPGWGRWVLRGVVEAVDPSPREVGDSVGQGLSARVAERGVAEALVAPDSKSGASANSAKPANVTRTGLEPVTH